MATFVCRVQFLDDTDPFNSTNFPEPTRPPQYTFREDIPLINQIAGVHRLLKAPHKLDDCALQLSQNGSYLDLESTLAEQRDELEGFQEGGRGKKHSIILRTQLSVRVHACIEKLYNSNGRELRRALFSLKQIFQDDKDLVHEFVVSEGLTCLIKVGAEADQNYQNYILRALGQIMLYVDGMNGLISHNETVQWLYTLVGSKFRLVVKTALKLLLVFVEYTEPNTALLIHAVNTVDTKRGCKLWSNAMEILEEKDGVDTELLVYAMTLINKTLAGLPDQDSFYDVVDCLEEQGMEAMSQRHRSRKGTDLDLMEQFNIYEVPPPPRLSGIHFLKTAVDGKRQEIIVLDSKRSNAINIGLTVLPPPRTIKTAILNFDEYALNKEGIEKILTMIPTEEEKQRIQDAQLVNPDVPLGSAEQFLLTLSSITELSARLQLWAFKMDYEVTEKEVAEPLQDLKEGMDQLEKNKTLRYILSTLLAIGNFLNGSNAKGFELGYLEKVPEVKDTVHKQSLLHHACSIVVEKFPDSSDLYSEIGAITRSAKVDFDQLQDNLSQMERRCKASWDHLKVIAKHEMKPALKQKMSDFLKDCAERIIILKIVHRRIINRFHAFLLFLGHPAYAVREVSIHRFSKILSEFALEYRTTRERVLQQKQKRANHRERNKTRGKMITDVSVVVHLTGLLMGSGSNGALLPIYRVGQTQTRPQGVRIHRQTDAADEIMERIVRSATQGPRTRTEPRERKRSRANRKSLRRTLKSGLTPEEANALGLSSGSEMAV
uniref:Formin homology 2 domain containing 3b n=1 Tax=Oncorhynchus mykiss TaxID=8022 RepID=A0A8K9XV43_ONCMY